MVCQDTEVLLRLHREPNTPQNPEIRWTDHLAGVAMDRPRCALLFGDEFNVLVLDTLASRWRADVRFLVSKNRAGASVLTLTSSLADKGTTLRVACADLGIELADVVAMGDSETDIEMFKVAGAGVAMGQAADDVQQAATWVTATHADDGVGVAIEQLLAGRRDGR